MSRAVAVGKELARRHRPRSIVADKVAKLGEAERAELSKYLDQMDVEVQRKLAQLKNPTFSNDRWNSNRVLNFFGIANDERRKNVIWRYSLATAFIGSWWAGRCQTRACLAEQQEETAKHAT